MLRLPSTGRLIVVLALVLSIGCARAFSRKYEYEEDLYLNLDGSATLYLNASMPALVALRGLDLPVDPRARFDRRASRTLFEAPQAGLAVESLTTSRRDGRRYVHLRFNVEDVRTLGQAEVFAWSRYAFGSETAGDEKSVRFEQQVGAPSGPSPRDTGWSGEELVAFRLHLPSRVLYENSSTSEVQRGNIVAWEQPLAARLAGTPVDIQVRIESRSILVSTLLLFGSMILLAAAVFGGAIWWVMRRGRAEAAA